ncbi:hypothetical protein SADUNF_Sadunf01G0127000 [Salix dunnii]|uniref:Uncharacterized protein n=1 Tax=Salix dunnii TaxID=1413687 RepID=A0A835NB12_9ROSI|nr:hypothetical protein SADUNF_Sadunf01G0127000 [Salix dunnii]
MVLPLETQNPLQPHSHLWKPPPLLPISLPLTLLSSLSPIFYLSLISSSFKELRILLILICFACLLMEPGVITKGILVCCQSCHLISSSSSNNSLCLLFLRPIKFSLTINC